MIHRRTVFDAQGTFGFAATLNVNPLRQREKLI